MYNWDLMTDGHNVGGSNGPDSATFRRSDPNYGVNLMNNIIILYYAQIYQTDK
jgi:hypothetical protein